MQRFIQEGRVTVDGVAPKPSTTLRAGQRVRFVEPPPPPPMPLPQDIPLKILHEDDAILVIDKPADLVVHSSPGVIEGGSMVNALLMHTDQLSTEGGLYRPGIVHRLDRHTSGVIVVARTDAAHRSLAAQFKERTVQKVYEACVHGCPEEETGVIDLPIGRSLSDPKKMAIRHDDGGRASLTRYTVQVSGERFSWMTLYPATGRTHQLRVHLRSLGHSIVCDAVYGHEKKITRSALLGQNQKSGESPILYRQALHARRLVLQHPDDERWLEFESPLPADLTAVRAVLTDSDDE